MGTTMGDGGVVMVCVMVGLFTGPTVVDMSTGTLGVPVQNRLG